MVGLYVFLIILFGYLLGAVPFGLILTKIVGLDLRQTGSGNTGASNVLRTGRKDLAAATLLLDALKGLIPTFLGIWVGIKLGIGPDLGPAAGFAAAFGHCYPIYARFKGGKAIATGFGALFAALWPAALLAGLVWLVVAFTAKISSVASLSAFTVAFLLTLFFHPASSVHNPDFYSAAVPQIFTGALMLLAYYRHIPNIKRLIAGTEHKIGKKKA